MEQNTNIYQDKILDLINDGRLQTIASMCTDETRNGDHCRGIHNVIGECSRYYLQKLVVVLSARLMQSQDQLDFNDSRSAAEIKKLDADNKKLEADNKKLEADKDQLAVTNSRLIVANCQLASTIPQMQAQLTASNDRIRELEAQPAASNAAGVEE